MLQPFELFNANLLDRLVKLDRPYVVSQTYHRAPPSPEEKVQLLLTEYHERGGAKIHFNAVKKDKYAAILDLQNDIHRKKLKDMLSPDSKYRLFFAVVKSVKGLENQIDKLYREKIKTYISRHTNWTLNSRDEVKVSVGLSFGELFLVLKHTRQTIRLRLDDIEAVTQ